MQNTIQEQDITNFKPKKTYVCLICELPMESGQSCYCKRCMCDDRSASQIKRAMEKAKEMLK